MFLLRWVLALLASVPVLAGATLGTVVNVTGGVSDIVLDDARGRLYLVRGTPYNQIDIYSIAQRRILNSVRTDANPLAAAMSRDGRILYVVCHDASALNVFDLDAPQPALIKGVSLPAKPEAVAVGADERVLITTIGTGTNNTSNVLLLYNPQIQEGISVSSVVTVPPAPTPPNLTPPAGRRFLGNRSQLITSANGEWIIGLNSPNQTTRTVFVFEVASGTVLRSRSAGDISSVFSVAPDGSRFMAGVTLFETASLSVLAQQNAANSPFPFAINTSAAGFLQVQQQFRLQQNQGGSVFSPDGSILYTAFDIAPVQAPAARPNVSQLLLNDPDNLLIHGGFQLPENLAGKMVISADGGTIFSLSESGFVIIPIGTAPLRPMVMPESRVAVVANDQCGTAGLQTSISVRNVGQGRITASASVVQGVPTGTAGLGEVRPGTGAPGGGQPGGGVVIVFPPVPGAGQPGTLPPGTTPQQAQVQQTAPQMKITRFADGATLDFTYNSLNARSVGTAVPHDYLIQAPEAVNIAPVVRVFQNNRDTEARAGVIPIETSIAANEGLTDMVTDQRRQRLYIANSGMNRLEVFDMRTRRFLAPVKVGQLPRSLALTPDGGTLYVGNSGGEHLSIVDPESLEQVGRVRFPPIPFNASFPIISPSVIVATQRGVQIVMSDGTLWSVVGDEAVPRRVSPITGRVIPAPRTMAATPNGEYAILVAGNGFVYLYDALVDEYVQGRQIFTAPIQRYYGPVTAGPRGQYFVVNGTILNQSLTPVTSATLSISAVTAAGANTFARFVQPTRANAAAPVTTPPIIQIVDANSGATRGATAAALEGPLSVQIGTTRVNVDGRTMALDDAATTAYVLTTSGLSIVPLESPPVAERPEVNRDGVVNLASYLTQTAPGGWISIFGSRLGADATAGSTPLPTILGGVCVTLNNVPMPLSMTSPGQINAQVPYTLAPGRYPLQIRAIDEKSSSAVQQLTISRYAPAVYVDASGTAAVYHADGRPVTKEHPGKRDESLVIYATGLGVTRGPRMTAGVPVPSEPAALTEPVQVFFDDSVCPAHFDTKRPCYRESEMIVEWSGLVPNLIGVYQIDVRVPGTRRRADDLLVILRVGGVDSPISGPAVPRVAIQ